MIWCKTNREVRVALRQLELQGCEWNSGDKPTALYQSYDQACLYVNSRKKITIGDHRPNGAVDASELYSNLLR